MFCTIYSDFIFVSIVRQFDFYTQKIILTLRNLIDEKKTKREKKRQKTKKNVK